MKKLRILHLVNDWVFTDGPLSLFRGMPIINKFVILKSCDNLELRQVKQSEYVSVVKIGTNEDKKLLEPGQWDVVWVFGLNFQKANFVQSLNKSVLVVWSVYGIDYVDYSGQWLLGSRSTLLWLKTTALRAIVKIFALFVLSRLQIVRYLPRWECKFFRRVNYFSCVVPEEECLVRHAVGFRRDVERVDFHYIPMEAENRQYPVVDLAAKRIWVGNSATLTNNHLEMFDAILKCDKGREFDVLVPLSYTTSGVGENAVTKAVTDSGKRCFGMRFKPIYEMMGRDEYIELMASCSVFVFGHRRQQSAGNLQIALRCGGCIFMDRHNPLYWHYKNRGIVIYDVAVLRHRKIQDVIRDFEKVRSVHMTAVQNATSMTEEIKDIRNTVDFLSSKVVEK